MVMRLLEAFWVLFSRERMKKKKRRLLNDDWGKTGDGCRSGKEKGGEETLM